jgi:hypothetical protein
VCVCVCIYVYWNILTIHGPINVKSPNNTSKWQMGFNSTFKGLKTEAKVFYTGSKQSNTMTYPSLG